LDALDLENLIIEATARTINNPATSTIPFRHCNIAPQVTPIIQAGRRKWFSSLMAQAGLTTQAGLATSGTLHPTSKNI